MNMYFSLITHSLLSLCGGAVLCCVQLFVTAWTAACQAPLSMEFSRKEYWSGLPFPSPGDLLDRGVERRSPALQADSLLSGPQGSPSPMSAVPISLK